eukprot:g4751.t1
MTNPHSTSAKDLWRCADGHILERLPFGSKFVTKVTQCLPTGLLNDVVSEIVADTNFHANLQAFRERMSKREHWHPQSNGQHNSKWVLQDIKRLGPGSRALHGLLTSKSFARAAAEWLDLASEDVELFTDVELSHNGGFHIVKPGGRLARHTDWGWNPGLNRYRRAVVMLYLNSHFPSDPTVRSTASLHFQDLSSSYFSSTGESTTGLHIDAAFNTMALFRADDGSAHGHNTPLSERTNGRIALCVPLYSDRPGSNQRITVRKSGNALFPWFSRNDRRVRWTISGELDALKQYGPELLENGIVSNGLQLFVKRGGATECVHFAMTLPSSSINSTTFGRSARPNLVCDSGSDTDVSEARVLCDEAFGFSHQRTPHLCITSRAQLSGVATFAYKRGSTTLAITGLESASGHLGVHRTQLSGPPTLLNDAKQLRSLCTIQGWGGPPFCELLTERASELRREMAARARDQRAQSKEEPRPRVWITDREGRRQSTLTTSYSLVVLQFVCFDVLTPTHALVDARWRRITEGDSVDGDGDDDSIETRYLLDAQTPWAFSNLNPGTYHLSAQIASIGGEPLGANIATMIVRVVHSSDSDDEDEPLDNMTDEGRMKQADRIKDVVGTSNEWIETFRKAPRCLEPKWWCVLSEVMGMLGNPMTRALPGAAKRLLNRGGMWLEFGCYKGASLALMAQAAKRIRPATVVSLTSVVGFDSFRGIPEAWIPGWEARALDLDGVFPPTIQQLLQRDSTVKVVPGWFNETLAPFLRALRDAPRGDALFPASLLHIDCDVYTSTRDVLWTLQLHGAIGEGTVIVFDELINYPGFAAHEWRAWREFAAEFRVSFRVLFVASRPKYEEELAEESVYDETGMRYKSTAAAIVVENMASA